MEVNKALPSRHSLQRKNGKRTYFDERDDRKSSLGAAVGNRPTRNLEVPERKKMAE